MRIILACLVLLIAPPVVIVVYKHYQVQQPQLPAQPVSTHGRTGEVLFFNASWCGPCRQMKPIVSQLKRQGFHMRDIDIDKNQNLATKYGIRAVPTFVFVENGAEVKRFSGGTSAASLKKMCASSVYH